MSQQPELSREESIKIKNELKQLESDYLILGRELSEIRERGLSSSSFSEHTALFQKKLEKADKLALRAYKTETSKCITMDCELLSNISSFNPQLTELVETDTQVFSPNEFAKKLILAINPSSALAAVEEEEELASQSFIQASMNQSTRSSQRSRQSVPQKNRFISTEFSIDDLRTFGREWSTYNNEAPTYDYILGAFEAIAPPKVERSQRPRIKHNFDSTQRVKPADAKDDEVRDVVTEQVENLYDRVHEEWEKEDRKPVPMFEVLLDKESFSHTISNIFHSSFLVKSGSIGVSRDSAGRELIDPLRDQETNEQQQNASRPRNQSVLSFNKADWQKWVAHATRL
jgi:hypothetical protein